LIGACVPKSFTVYEIISAAMFWSYLVKLLFNYFRIILYVISRCLMCTLIKDLRNFYVGKTGCYKVDLRQGTSSTASKIHSPVLARPLLCFPSRGTRSWYWALFCISEGSSEVGQIKPHTFWRVWIWMCRLIRYQILVPNVATWNV